MGHDQSGRANGIMANPVCHDEHESGSCEHHHLFRELEHVRVVGNESIDVTPPLQGEQNLPIVMVSRQRRLYCGKSSELKGWWPTETGGLDREVLVEHEVHLCARPLCSFTKQGAFEINRFLQRFERGVGIHFADSAEAIPARIEIIHGGGLNPRVQDVRLTV